VKSHSELNPAASLPEKDDDFWEFAKPIRPLDGNSKQSKQIHFTQDLHKAIKQRAKAAKPPATSGTSGINYHNGPIIVAKPTLYYIFYGNMWSDHDKLLLTEFAKGLGGVAPDYSPSAWMRIQSTYYQMVSTVKTSATVTFNFGGSTIVPTSQYGTSLTDANIKSIVTYATSQSIPPLLLDTNSVYLVLTSREITASSGFCTQYCGWHTHATISNKDIKYGFVGNAVTQCPAGCMDQAVGPNDDPSKPSGVDGMVSVIAHEFAESQSDPDLNAWYDRRGEENADKCAWTFGTTKTLTGTNVQYNINLGAYNWLIQRNWVNAGGGYCAMSY